MAPRVPPPVTVTPLPAGAQVQPVGFVHVVVKLPDGEVWAKPHVGLFCMAGLKQTWQAGQQEQKITEYQAPLREEMMAAGFKVDGDPDNLFQPTASTSDLQLAAIITDMNIDFCMPKVGFGDTSAKGTSVMSVQWQLYSSIRKTVLAKIDTTGGVEFKTSTPGGLHALMMGAYKENIRALIVSDAFRKVVLGSQGADAAPPQPAANPPILLPGALGSAVRPVSDAVAAVVMISAGETQGSGFLVSADGMLLTDQHVVGGAKYVKVRWPDGIETLGEVIRTDKIRDVALVKTDARGRTPLHVRRELPQPGDTVFAIGAPLEQRFQSTVTRGVVSANRTFEGLSFIQSDVSVNPGSSGGPLLDEHGHVVGLTEAGYRLNGAPSGINLFVPVGDALEFLSAEPK